jgi:hypothetical protein
MKKVALLMIFVGVTALYAADLAAQVVGSWNGRYKNHTIVSLVFTKRSFNLVSGAGGFDTASPCTISGSYRINSDDELLVTPHTVDGGGLCDKYYPEFEREREFNLGAVEFASDNKMLIGGRLTATRLAN